MCMCVYVLFRRGKWVSSLQTCVHAVFVCRHCAQLFAWLHHILEYLALAIECLLSTLDNVDFSFLFLSLPCRCRRACLLILCFYTRITCFFLNFFFFFFFHSLVPRQSFSRVLVASHSAPLLYMWYFTVLTHIDVVSLSIDDDDDVVDALLSLRQTHSQNMHIKFNLCYGVPIRVFRANKIVLKAKWLVRITCGIYGDCSFRGAENSLRQFDFQVGGAKITWQIVNGGIIRGWNLIRS